MAKRRGRNAFFEKSGLDDNIVEINRSAKVVKGGRRFSFSALAVVGDKKGRVGIGYGKANEVPPAIQKAIGEGSRSLHEIALKGDTIPHEVIGRHGAAQVYMRPAGPGTGVIAGGGVRAVCQMVGIHNILTKSMGSTNPVNLVKAALDGLMRLKDIKEVARLRGVPLEELQAERARAGGEGVGDLASTSEESEGGEEAAAATATETAEMAETPEPETAEAESEAAETTPAEADEADTEESEDKGSDQ